MIPNTLATIRTYLRSAADTRATGYATEYSYRPAEKRLTDHRRRTLSYADITQYRSICAALAEMPPHWGFESKSALHYSECIRPAGRSASNCS